MMIVTAGTYELLFPKFLHTFKFELCMKRLTKLKHAACSIAHSETVFVSEDLILMSLPLLCRSDSESQAILEIV